MAAAAASARLDPATTNDHPPSLEDTMHGLGLLFALMEMLRGTAEPPETGPAGRGADPVEPLDDATFDAWGAWARGERSRWSDPLGPAVPSRNERPATPVIAPPERGVLGRI
jgi:hypothetical protein